MIVIGKKLKVNNINPQNNEKNNFFLIIVFYFFSLVNLPAIEPDVFVQSTVNRASKILSEELSKEKKWKN